MQLDSKPYNFSSYTTSRQIYLPSLAVGGGEQGEGAGPGSGQRSTGSPGGGGAASPGGGAERGGAGGAVSPHPKSPLEAGCGEPVANACRPGAHADAHSRRTAGGERHVRPEGMKGGGRGKEQRNLITVS